MPTVIALLFAATLQAQTSQTMGIVAPAATLVNCSTNAAANYCAFAWTTGQSAETLSQVWIMMNSVTGTVPIGDLQLNIYANSGGQPDTSSLASATSTVAGAASTWQQWTGLSLSLTANTQYWFVVRNNNATPASNFVVFRYLQGINVMFGGGTRLTAAVATSTNSGSTWTNVGNSTPLMRLEYSGSKFAGAPIETYTALSGANYRVWGTREVGIRFTTPANVSPKMDACAFGGLLKSGSPSGIRCKIRQVNSGGGTTTTVATSVDITGAQYATSAASNTLVPLATSYALLPSTDYLVVLASTNTSDTSTNYTVGSTFTFNNTTGSLNLTPFAGSLRGAYCAGTCDTWANWTTSNEITAGAIELDFLQPFASISGGSAGCSYAFIK